MHRGNIKPFYARQNSGGNSLAFSGRLRRSPFLSRDLDLVLKVFYNPLRPESTKIPPHLCLRIFERVVHWPIVPVIFFLLLGDSPASEIYIPIFFLLSAPMKMEQRVPKRRRIKLRRREITTEKEYAV